MYNDAEQQVYWLDDNVEMDDTLSSTATFFIDPQLKHDTKVNSWSEGNRQHPQPPISPF